MNLGPYELNTIVTGDARILAEVISDNSVDLIFTDPVYQNIEDYGWLARMAARVLKPEKSVLAQCGNIYRFDCELAMSKFGLVHNPLILDYYEFSQHSIYKLKLVANVSPWVWYSKGSADNPFIPIAQSSYKAMGRQNNGRPISKIFFKWGDEETYYLKRIKAFTQPGAIVFDPFTGGGTVPAVCKMLGRNYLAFEIDPETANKARQRVEMTQPPLFVLQPEQGELF